ncbi:MAG: hypothetical protein ACTHWA_04405 [Arachnia sp.]
MSGQVSESAKMTLHGNTDGESKDDGVGMNDGIPPASEARHAQGGRRKDYPSDVDTDADNEHQDKK